MKLFSLFLFVSTLVLSFCPQTYAGGSITIGDDNMLDLGWALKAQAGKDYKIEFRGFSSDDPKIVVLDAGKLSFSDSTAAVNSLAKRYSACVDIQLDLNQKVVSVSPLAMVRVLSSHVENSTYEVDGQQPFTMETKNETQDRYFCVHRPDLIKKEWQKRAFLK